MADKSDIGQKTLDPSRTRLCAAETPAADQRAPEAVSQSANARQGASTSEALSASSDLAPNDMAPIDIDSPLESFVPGLAPYELEELSGVVASTLDAECQPMPDVELDLTIEWGRARMQMDDLTRLSGGDVVPLDNLADEPVDVYVNGRLIARGEVLALRDHFCVRINELIGGTRH